MPNIHNRDFSGGWKPSSDAANSEPNSFPRADNLDLEDDGVLSLRQGSDTRASVEGSDITSLLSVELAGSSRVLAASPTAVYDVLNDVATGLGFSTDGDTDTAQDSVSGHALIASGTVKKKYDGTTVRNWGLATPLEPPDVGSTALPQLSIAVFTSAAAEFTANEGTLAYVTGQDGVANAAVGLTPAVGTGRGEMTYTFSSARNLQDFSGAEGGLFDVFEFWFWNPDITKFKAMQIQFGLGTGSDAFETDGYLYQFGSGLDPIGLTPAEIRAAAQDSVAAATAPEPEPGDEAPDPARDPTFPGNDRREDDAENRRDRRGRL